MYKANSILIDSMIIHDSQGHPTIISVHRLNSNYEEFSVLTSEQTHDFVTSIECRELNIIQLSKGIFYNHLNLQYIDIRSNTLLKLSSKFKLLKHLRTLKIDSNSISAIPSWIGDLKAMTFLSLSNNSVKYVSSSICHLPALIHLDLSFNKIDSIPIEIGELQQLEVLLINNNYFTQLPTTLGMLKHLTRIALEWFEFAEKPSSSEVTTSTKDNALETFLQFMNDLMRNQLMFHCSFTYFISNFNRTDALINPLTDAKMLYAVEMNYYGIVRDYIITHPDFCRIKNGDNKTMLYLSFDYKMSDLSRMLLSHSDLNRISKRQYYLNKAIRFFNCELVEVLLETGADFNEADIDGNTPYHILFSLFTTETIKCCKIGELLIRFNINGRNQLNHHGWAPIHIAIRKGNVKCLKWIKAANEYLRNNNMREFDFDLAGNNGWTPMHITVNDYKIEETLFLTQSGCNIFKRNKCNYTPRQVSDGNYLLSKYLKREEQRLMEQLIAKNVKRLNNLFSPARTNKLTQFFKSQLSSNCNVIDYTNGKYELFLRVKDSNCLSVENVIRNKLREYKCNENIFLKHKLDGISDICQLIVGYNLYKLMPLLESLREVYKKCYVIVSEIDNAISILSSINDSNKEGGVRENGNWSPFHQSSKKVNWVIKEYTNAFSYAHSHNKVIHHTQYFSQTVGMSSSFISQSNSNSNSISDAVSPVKAKSLSKTSAVLRKKSNPIHIHRLPNSKQSNTHINQTGTGSGTGKSMRVPRKSQSINLKHSH